MRHDSASPHLTADEAQRCADGARDAPLVAHVEACAACREAVERQRRAAAALALASRPPDDLLGRIQARRRAHERVILPVGADVHDGTSPWASGHPPPEALDGCDDDGSDDADGTDDRQAREARDALRAHLEGCRACRDEVERARRAVAALSLTSSPPAELLERVRARRAAGERVLLPAVPHDRPHDVATEWVAPVVAPAARVRRRAWRWAARPLAAAAVVLLVLRAAPRVDDGSTSAPPTADAPAADAPTTDASPGSGPAARPAPVPAASAFAAADAPPTVRGGAPRSARAQGDVRRGMRSDPVPAAAPARDSSAVVGAGAAVAVRETADGLSVGLIAREGALDEQQAAALDSAAAWARSDSTWRIVIRYTDPSLRRASASWRLVERVEDRLLLAGVASERVRAVRVATVSMAGLAAGADAIEVVVQRGGGGAP
jgi:hypothetical protein